MPKWALIMSHMCIYNFSSLPFILRKQEAGVPEGSVKTHVRKSGPVKWKESMGVTFCRRVSQGWKYFKTLLLSNFLNICLNMFFSPPSSSNLKSPVLCEPLGMGRPLFRRWLEPRVAGSLADVQLRLFLPGSFWIVKSCGTFFFLLRT